MTFRDCILAIRNPHFGWIVDGGYESNIAPKICPSDPSYSRNWRWMWNAKPLLGRRYRGFHSFVGPDSQQASQYQANAASRCTRQNWSGPSDPLCGGNESSGRYTTNPISQNDRPKNRGINNVEAEPNSPYCIFTCALRDKFHYFQCSVKVGELKVAQSNTQFLRIFLKIWHRHGVHNKLRLKKVYIRPG